MKLHIGDKIFIGRFDEKNIVKVVLNNDEDVKYFYNLILKYKEYKIKYVIKFEKIAEQGILIGCFFRLDINEEFVEIHYDVYKLYEFWKPITGLNLGELK